MTLLLYKAIKKTSIQYTKLSSHAALHTPRWLLKPASHYLFTSKNHKEILPLKLTNNKMLLLYLASVVSEIAQSVL